MSRPSALPAICHLKTNGNKINDKIKIFETWILLLISQDTLKFISGPVRGGEDKDMNSLFREQIQTDNKHMKRCLAALIIKEMQIKTTMK